MLRNSDKDHFSNSGSYDKICYVISYPRSANTWMRHITECVSAYKSFGYATANPEIDGKPISQQPEEFWDLKGIIRKRHVWDTFDQKNLGPALDKTYMILILRNPVDLLARGSLKGDGYGGRSMYMECIKAWRDAECKKAIITYDTLVTKPEVIAGWLPDFLELDTAARERASKFISKIDDHRSFVRGRADESRKASVDSWSGDFTKEGIKSALEKFKNAGQSQEADFETLMSIFGPDGDRYQIIQK